MIHTGLSRSRLILSHISKMTIGVIGYLAMFTFLGNDLNSRVRDIPLDAMISHKIQQ